MAARSAIEEGMDPLERGRRRYQQKDYSGALGAFAEAVELSNGNLLLAALDHRAAAYEKIGQLQAALRDARQMIELKPDLAKGYLRCGKVLQIKGEKDLALKIYERGLRKVKIGTDNDRVILQSMFNKLRQALDPGKSFDPLEFLPFELAEMVLKSLEMRDRVICLAVSKPWKRLLESSYKLWTTFDTTFARKPVSQHSLKMHLRRSNYTLDTAIISTRAKFDSKKLQRLTQTCKKLKHLQISGTGVIGESLTDSLPFARSLSSITISANCQISLAAVLVALTACQATLVDAKFLRVKGGYTFHHPWPMLESLRSLELRCYGSDFVHSGTSSLRDATPNIRSLTLVGWQSIPFDQRPDYTQCKYLEFLELSNESCCSLPLLPPSIKHLNLRANLHLGTRGGMNDETFKLPLLESFDCTSTPLSGELIKKLTHDSIEAGNLRRFSIGGRLIPHQDTPVEDEYPASETVLELSMPVSDMPEARIIEVARLYPKLEKLDVTATRVTGVAIKEFVNMGVKWLKCIECRYISPDAIDYARGNGVEVVYNFPSLSRVTSFRDSAFTSAG